MIKFIYYLILINLIGFFIMGYDKRKAKRSEWRVSERILMTVSIVGGSIGMLFGMRYFRHKTKHKLFIYGIPLILIVQIGIILYSIGKF